MGRLIEELGHGSTSTITTDATDNLHDTLQKLGEAIYINKHAKESASKAIDSVDYLSKVGVL